MFQNAFPEKTNFWQDGFARSFIWDWIAPIGGISNDHVTELDSTRFDIVSSDDLSYVFCAEAK